MIHLAIECSGLHGSVALLEGGQIISLLPLPENRSSVQSLAPAVKSLLTLSGSQPLLISITNGPGSFTGLRVGLATAKMLGMAWQIPIVAVDTLEVIAAKLHHRLGHDFDGTLIPVINAFRGQVFSSAWSVGPFGRFVPILRCQVVDAAQWCSQPLKSLVAPPTAEDCSAEPATSEPRHQPKTVDHQELVVAGPGLKVYQPIDPVQSFPDLVPDAHWVGAVGWRGFTAGRAVNANTLMANYVRPSAAEEKRSEVPGSPSA